VTRDSVIIDAGKVEVPQSESSQSLKATALQGSDADLWTALKQGQVEMLGILYDRHVGLVYAIALRVLQNSQDAEDLTQDIFLRLSQTNYDPQRVLCVLFWLC
jgi:RNA polymerase sigma-70 factor (ECF subfamily)